VPPQQTPDVLRLARHLHAGAHRMKGPFDANSAAKAFINTRKTSNGTKVHANGEAGATPWRMMMKIKKTVSHKVRGANRKNGQLCPGPKTLAGKNATEPGMKATKAIDNPGVGEISPSELWRGLRHKEEQMSEDAFKRWQTLFANQRFFSYALFGPPHYVSDESRESVSDPGVKYNFLLLLLRNCRTSEERLFLLATWLHVEGICKPRDLLGKDFSQYRRRAARGSRGHLSFTDLRQAFIVNTWEPYF
jgi:hypothetical protein